MSARTSRLKSLGIVCTSGVALFSAHALLTGNEKFYRQYVMPILRSVTEAETAHRLSVNAAKFGLLPRLEDYQSARLKCSVWGREFRNPVGLAAGFDKHGEVVDAMLSLGFGFVEVGSVTPKPQEGNAKPRVFRLVEDKGIINRYGFNSDGHDAVLKRLKARHRPQKQPVTDNGSKGCQDDRNMLNVNFYSFVGRISAPVAHRKECKGLVGVNLGKNKDSPDSVADYVEGVNKFGSVADYLVINVSSPNTPGLRDMQQKEKLQDLITKVVDARNHLTCRRKPPLLVKIAPDMNEQDKNDVAAVVGRPGSGVDGLVVSNTTVSRPENLKSRHRDEIGGLSGAPLKDMATRTIRDMYRLTYGRVPIVGVGGVTSGADAYEKIRAGASLVQIYTSLTYEGPPVANRVKRELDQLLQKDGYNNVQQAVGADFTADTVTLQPTPGLTSG